MPGSSCIDALTLSYQRSDDLMNFYKDPPRRKKTIPQEQTKGWVHTRDRVGKAAASVLGTATDVAHEILFTGVTVLACVPVPGLAPFARVLLQIWDALQSVDTNRLQCLRLTQRCADILLSVHEEVKEAGDQVDEELQTPITKLTESFQTVESFLLKQIHRPFLKRYLKRDEIQAQILSCDAQLTEALCMLGLSIQIKILRSVQDVERERREDQRVLVNILRGESGGVGLGVSGIDTQAPGMGVSESAITVRPEHAMSVPSPGMPRTLQGTPTISDPSPADNTQVLPTLKAVQASQDAQDLEDSGDQGACADDPEGAVSPPQAAAELDPNVMPIPVRVQRVFNTGWTVYVPLDLLTNAACHRALTASNRHSDFSLSLTASGELQVSNSKFDHSKEHYMSALEFMQASATLIWVICLCLQASPEALIGSPTARAIATFFQAHYNYIQHRLDFGDTFPVYLAYNIYIHHAYLQNNGNI
ncbi:hypothetical protein J132_08409 [Termitomyces sp. J132]|nr:hypothetical protein J132_08409 [Termitomyces sp. J132]